MILVSIDPGVHGFGWSTFINSTLVHAGRVSEIDTLSWTFADCLVIELPQVYRAARSKGDPNDLIDLAFVAGRIAERFRTASIVTIRPHAWKGATPKPKRVSELYVIATRCQRILSAEEVGNIALPRNVKHSWDVWDAVGIGLHHLGRFR